jgi:prophage DNA circulation protein
MREPKVRETTAAGTRFAHAFYSSLADCVKDFRLYWDYFKYPRFISNAVEVLPITEKYVKELRKNKYFEAEPGHYLRGLQHYYRLYYE